MENVIKKGDLFYTSWGYDQTNYDYLMVIGFSKTGKTALCKMTIHEEVGYTGQSHIQKPLPKPYGITFRMKVVNKSKWFRSEETEDKEVILRGSYPFCNDQSSKRLDTFNKVEKDQTFYETDTQFGH